MDVLNMSSIARSVTVRLIVVGVLSVVLFVPLMMVWGLVGERSARRDEVAREVSAVWGGPQHVGSLALVIPIERVSGALADSTGTAASFAERRLVVLPEALRIEARLDPEIRRRSIFEVVLYRAHVTAAGEFRLPDPSAIALAPDETLQLANATLRIGIADLRGVVAVDALEWGAASLEAEPGTTIASLGPGLSAPVPVLPSSSMPFRIELTIAGADRLMFMPSGKRTDIAMTSSWTSPGFTGVRLPEQYAITADGFTAEWQSTFLSRPFPQVWIENAADTAASAAPIDQSTFGVNLVTPVDNYQQTERAVKYGFLFIVMTLGLVLMRELTGPRRIHPVQYLFVGLALVVFYLLLLSISEHIPFVVAYAVAAVATIALVGSYATRIFDGRKDGVIITGALAVLYGTLFVLLQLEDLALLVGAVMVFGVLALAMYLTRWVDWYGKA